MRNSSVAVISLIAWRLAPTTLLSRTLARIINAALPAGGLNTLVAAGVFLVLLSFLGWVGVRWNSKAAGRVVLGFYSFFLCLTALLEFIGAGAVVAWSGRLGDFSAAQQFRDQGIYYLVNMSYTQCCCNLVRCPNESCWIPAALPYPCDSVGTFATFLEEYINDKLIPICVVAILLAFLQIFTAISACCNQCRGRKAQEAAKIAGPVTYDGLYEGEEQYAGYGYEGYVKGGAARPAKPTGGAPAAGGAEGATAPKAPAAAGGAAGGRPAGGRAPAGGKKPANS